MPPKLAANMHVVQPKGLGQFLSIDNQLVSWGGTDPYEYVFEPEQLGEQSKVEPKLNNSAAEADRGVSNRNIRKRQNVDNRLLSDTRTV